MMTNENDDDSAARGRVSENAPHYGKPTKFQGKKVRVPVDERKKMPAPAPAEPKYVAELIAEAERRERAGE
jgi:hypothetical protein